MELKKIKKPLKFPLKPADNFTDNLEMYPHDVG